MLKILVLQTWYNLSDDQTEYQIRDRLSFIRFLGLDLDHRIPDAKTIWLFRETLAQAQIVETLFAQFDSYLAKHGLQPCGGQLIDASLVPVPKQYNSRDESATIKNGECPAEWEHQSATRCQKDHAARWTMKHGKPHYGYKNHVNVDKKHKLIRQYTVTDAVVQDTMATDPDFEWIAIDSTIVRPHQHAAGAKGGQQNQALGRSRGAFSTKIHALVDALGNPVKFLLTGGQVADMTQTPALLANLNRLGAVLADKAYDAQAVLDAIKLCGAQAVTSPKISRRIQRML